MIPVVDCEICIVSLWVDSYEVSFSVVRSSRVAGWLTSQVATLLPGRLSKIRLLCSERTDIELLSAQGGGHRLFWTWTGFGRVTWGMSDNQRQPGGIGSLSEKSSEGSWWVWGQPGIHSNFWVNICYRVKPLIPLPLKNPIREGE